MKTATPRDPFTGAASRPPRFTVLAAVLLAASVSRPALGYIERLYSLQEVLDECTNVLSGKLETIDREKGVVIALMVSPLKGTIEYQRIQMNIGLGPADHSRYLLEQWSEGDPVIVFYNRSGNAIASIAHAGDTWFQLYANHGRSWKDVWWRFTHVEIYMNRTFRGKTEELTRLVTEVLAGRAPGPPPDPGVPKLDISKARPRSRRAPAADPARAVVLAEKGGAWRYAKGSGEPSGEHDAWRQAALDDSAWASGPAPFGYGDRPFGTELLDMGRSPGNPGYTTLFLRRRFEVADPAAVKRLELHVDYDDGFIAWINGRPAAAANVPAGDPGHEAKALGDHESGSYEAFDAGACRDALVPGGNCLAVQVFNRDLTSSDLKLDLELRAEIDAGGRGRFRRLFALDLPESNEPRGISWADADGDGKLDACFARGSGNVLLLNGGGGKFSPAQEGSLGASRSAAWADADGDGDLDLLASDFKLFRNTGSGFEPAALPEPPGERNPEGAGWLDHDGDGWPDILITNGRHGIVLYRNSGRDPDRFQDVSAAAGLGASGAGAANGDFVAFADVDADGYTDFLYNLGDGLLARNRGDGAFEARAGTRLAMRGGSAWKRGAAFADHDNDGDLDVFIPGPEAPRLFVNLNDGTWEGKTAAGDLERRNTPSFSCAWGDADLDGSLDLFVCHQGEAGRLYAGDGAGSFLDLTEGTGLEGLEPALAASFADSDGDGDLDLALHLERRALILANQLRKKPGRRPLQVRLDVGKGRTGSVVRALDPEGKLLGLRELNGAEGCGGQAPAAAYFGLPQGPARITVCLSDGRFAAKTVEGQGESAALVFREEDFEE